MGVSRGWKREATEVSALLITSCQGHIRPVSFIAVDTDLGDLAEVGFARFVHSTMMFFSSLSIF